LYAEVDQTHTDDDGNWPWVLIVERLAPSEEPGGGEDEVGYHNRETEFGFWSLLLVGNEREEGKDLPKMPLFRFDMYFATPSMMAPATNVASTDAMNDETFVAPTALTEKLYGGAEKICESVIEIRTNHDIQTVNSSVAHMTIGETIIKNGRSKVLQNETWSK
jgi:hypothetical protein